MSNALRLESLLDGAKIQEKRYKWHEAAKLYEQALGTVGEEDSLRRGELWEQIGYCLYRGAFQAELQEEFKSRMREAAGVFERASEVYAEIDKAKSVYCRAMALYARSWTLIDASQKKAVLDDSGELMKKAMKAFEEAGDGLSYGKVCNALLFCLWDRRDLEWEWTQNEKNIEDATKHGQNAVSALSKAGDNRELARAYFGAGIHSIRVGLGALGDEKREKFTQTALTYAERACALSEKTGDRYLMALSNWLAAAAQFTLRGNLELSRKYGEEALHQAEKMKDSFLIGLSSLGLAMVMSWMPHSEEDPDKKREEYRRGIRHAANARRHLILVHRYDQLVYAHSWHSDNYYGLADEVETDLRARRSLLEKAIEVGREGLEYSKLSLVPTVDYVHHSLSKALRGLASLEGSITEKKRLLREALAHRERGISIMRQRNSPYVFWDLGVVLARAALVKADLASTETDEEKRKMLLDDAVSYMENGIDLCTKWVTIYPAVSHFALVGWYYSWFGGILDQMYSLTGEPQILGRAMEVYQSSADTYQKAELPSRVAEANWYKARLHDQLKQQGKSERSFQSAAENYRLAAEKIPQLREFYMDHALYMEAWSEIEQAKQHHAEKQYGLAKEHYEKAANLHKSTERWNYLSPNYLALALVEEAEDLSRKEQTEEAMELFEQAAKQFAETKDSIETRLKTIDARDEKEVATQLAKASDSRRDYCLGRTVLEEAKILDRQGDHGASSRSYRAAAGRFQRVADAMEYELDRREVRPLVDLCRAWHMMTRAEAEAAPDLYLEAAQLFDEAKEHSLDEKAKVLALGHSSFCRALEAAARFEATSDMTMHSTAKKHMEAAEKYYLKAGFKTASAYAKATLMLSDAYMYMHEAETERDPRKKTQYYQMAEKLLQASAGSYTKAKHPEKSEEVGRLLEGVREKRQLAMSLAEVLHVPTITSSTTSFSTLTPTHEQAVGLERFEHADIQANLILRVKEVRLGEDIRLAIEVVNAGKAPALLIKVDEVVPKGFEIRNVPEMYTFEDSYINLKGKRLNPLKTEDVKVVVQPRAKGTHTIKPRILYIDETGKYKSHEPDPVTITVKELGIKGWIKGER